MSILDPAFYVKAQVLTASWEGEIIGTRGLNQLSFLLSWTDAGSPVGEVQLWATNDPRAEYDRKRGLTMATGEAQWIQLKLPAGSVDVDGTTATFVADERKFTVTGVGVGKAAINVVDIYAFMKLAYSRTGGGTGDTMNVTREGN